VAAGQYSVTPSFFALTIVNAKDNVACFIVRDHSGQALSYIYYENERRRRAAGQLLTRDEARCFAINVAKLPELVSKPPASP